MKQTVIFTKVKFSLIAFKKLKTWETRNSWRQSQSEQNFGEGDRGNHFFFFFTLLYMNTKYKKKNGYNPIQSADIIQLLKK